MKRAPGSIPDLYFFDPTNCVMVTAALLGRESRVIPWRQVMEHLNSHVLLNDALIHGDVTVEAALSLADFMGKVLARPRSCSASALRY
jgi:5-methylthioribose kinase